MVQVDEILWFHDKSGTYEGYIDKINRDTINVLVDDNSRPEGYQLWRVTEHFLSKTPEEAIKRWNEYLEKLKEVKEVLKMRRNQFSYRPGLEITVHPYMKEPYKANILAVDRITLIVCTEDKRFMRVDKAICVPTEYYD